MKRKQIDAIFSDYDGTLCSTTSVRGGISLVDTIPEELEQILFRISKHIPVCIISSKDFAFLHKRTRFTSILSCVLGIETVVHNSHYSSNNNRREVTSDREILIGLTIDYRHLEDWQSFKENKEPMLRETIQRSINTNLASIISSKSES